MKCCNVVLLSLLVVVSASLGAGAQPRCVFLECGPANTPNPTPATPPKIANAAPIGRAKVQHLPRPTGRGEVCSFAQGYDYCASSVLKPQYGNTYGPGHVIDENLRTAWVEGKRGQGIGEFLVVSLGKPHKVTGIQIMNGYHKNVRLFKANSRVRNATIKFLNGASRSITLTDAPGIQTIEFPAVEANWVQFKIGSVYRGSKYADTAVTELRILTAQD